MRTTPGRRIARAVVPLLAVALAFGPAPAVAAAATATPDPDATGTTSAPAGPTDVAIPYRGEMSITPSAPWTIADCAGPLAASSWVVACEPSSISLAAPDFDAEAGMIVLPVSLTDGSRSLDVEYRVSLAPPEAPTTAVAPGARPVAAGALLRIPVSDLGVRCTLCVDGVTVRAVGVEPAEAGAVWATPTHVVFRPSASYSGAAEVQFYVGDDVDTETAVIVPAWVYPGTASPLSAMDVYVALDDDGAASVDLNALVVSAGGEDAVLVACGPALVGAATCAADGTAEYSGPGAVDQFGFQFGAGGERAFGSVTFVPAGDERAAGDGMRPVPTAPGSEAEDASVTTPFIPLAPREEGEQASGVFAAIVAMLDRVGAR